MFVLLVFYENIMFSVISENQITKSLTLLSLISLAYMFEFLWSQTTKSKSCYNSKSIELNLNDILPN